MREAVATMGTDGPIAWVGEDSADDEALRPIATGVFSAHVEDDALPGGFQEGPQSVPVSVAITWARERAERVVVRYFAPEGQPYDYTAGTRQPLKAEEALPHWPPDGLDLSRRRMPGHEYLDRTDDEAPIAWDVGVDVLQGSGAPVPGLPARLADELQRDPAVSSLDWVPGPGGGPDPSRPESQMIAWTGSPGNIALRARIRLGARTVAAAEDTAIDTVGRALRPVLDTFGIAPRDDAFGWHIK